MKLKTIIKKWALAIALGAIAFPSISPAAIAEPVLVAQQSELTEAQKLNQQAIQLYQQGKYADAIPLVEKALAIQEQILGKENPDLVANLGILAKLYVQQANYDRAEFLLRRSLTIQQKTLDLNPNVDPKVSEKIALTLDDLASLFMYRGHYNKAEEILQRVIVIKEKTATIGPKHLSTAFSHNNLGLAYLEQGKYPEAETQFQTALQIAEESRQRNPQNREILLYNAQTLSNLGSLYRDRGNFDRAESHLQEALSILEKILGPEHPAVANSLNDLANIYSDRIYYATIRKDDVQIQAYYAKAEPLLQRALAILSKNLGQDNPAVAQSQNNLANLYSVAKKYDRAESLYQKAIDTLEKIKGSEHPDLADLLNNLAQLDKERGQYDRAEPLYQRACSIWEKALGKEHPNVARCLNNLALLYYAQNNISQAIAYFDRATNIEDKNIALILSIGSETQKRAYIETLANSPDLAISLHQQAAPNNPEAARLALTTILQRKGRILDALTDSLQVLRRNLTAEDRKLLDELNLMRSELAALIFRGAGNTPLDQYRSSVAALKTKLEQLEATLARRSANFRIQNQSISIAAVQQLVPDSAALVEISQYRPYNPQNSTWGNSRYVAYVLQSQGEPQWIDLGDAQAIDKLVDESRKEMRSKSPAVKQQARALDAKVMQPIRQLLGNKQKILLSPDSQLNLIPFAALVDENDRYLVENYAVSYLTTGRDLLRFQNESPSRQPPVILADPDYNLASASASAPVQNASVDRGSDSQRAWDLGSIQLKALPGTAQEARAIAPLLPGVTVLTQSQATENALKQLHGPNILHIATHGFFLRTVDLVASANYASGSEISSNQSNSTAKVQTTAKENPLLRSGIGLAGFNPRQSGSEDGVVTALEAAGLDLQGTKLVVLSACETGLGEVAGGEGVYGLRRAFVMAGSESQVISLWQVDDFGTMELMSGYYRRLSENESRSEALRQTQLKMLQDPKYQHPYFWAAFIPSGDWRTMNLSGQTQTTQTSPPQSQPSPDGRLLW